MANKFVRSGATGTNTGTSWLNAWTSIASAPVGMVAGDDLFIAHDHTQATNMGTLAFPGTMASPNRIICVNDSANYSSSSGATPAAGTWMTTPTALVESTNTSNFVANGGIYVNGLIWRGAPSGGNTVIANQQDIAQHWENCWFQHRATVYGGGAGRFIVGAAESNPLRTRVEFRNCDLQFNATSNRVGIGCAANWTWLGGNITSLQTTAFFLFQTKAGEITWHGVDMSTLPSGMVIAEEDWAGGPHVGAIVRMANCKMPSGWGGTSSLQAGNRKIGNSMLLTGFSSSNKYAVSQADCWGDVTFNTTIKRTGGAGDGTTDLASHQVVTRSSSFVNFPINVFYGPWMAGPFLTTGSKTGRVEIANNTVALKNDEVWIEVMAPNAAGSPVTRLYSSKKDDPLATGTAWPTSSEAWGGSPTQKQYIDVSFTINETGPVLWRVCVARASTTLYVDPMITVT